MSNRIVKRFEKASFENYICETAEQRALLAYLQEKCKQGFDENVFIIGGVGLGKTHLAYAVLKCMCERKTSRTYDYFSGKAALTTIQEIIDSVRTAWREKESDPLRYYKDMPLLIIDEVGVQYGTESERIELYDLINYRYNDMLPTIIISNLSLKQITDVLGQRITDRLIDGAKIFELKGKSKRGNNG